jgi:hypothetical protein
LRYSFCMYSFVKLRPSLNGRGVGFSVFTSPRCRPQVLLVPASRTTFLPLPLRQKQPGIHQAAFFIASIYR